MKKVGNYITQAKKMASVEFKLPPSHVDYPRIVMMIAVMIQQEEQKGGK